MRKSLKLFVGEITINGELKSLVSADDFNIEHIIIIEHPDDKGVTKDIIIEGPFRMSACNEHFMVLIDRHGIQIELDDEISPNVEQIIIATADMNYFLFTNRMSVNPDILDLLDEDFNSHKYMWYRENKTCPYVIAVCTRYHKYGISFNTGWYDDIKSITLYANTDSIDNEVMLIDVPTDTDDIEDKEVNDE